MIERVYGRRGHIGEGRELEEYTRSAKRL